jgi:hypothetical protein
VRRFMSSELILELMYWGPLAVLLASSLGLVVLKRLLVSPHWLRRLLSLHSISRPVATLTVGLEMLAWNAPTALAAFKFYDWAVAALLVLNFAGYFLAPSALSVVSGLMLSRTLADEEKEPPPSRVNYRRKALVLVFFFACAGQVLRERRAPRAVASPRFLCFAQWLRWTDSRIDLVPYLF